MPYRYMEKCEKVQHLSIDNLSMGGDIFRRPIPFLFIHRRVLVHGSVLGRRRRTASRRITSTGGFSSATGFVGSGCPVVRISSNIRKGIGVFY